MPTETKRDRVWISALEDFVGLGVGSTTPSGIAEDTGVSERTARKTLKVMADAGFVTEDRIPDGRVRYVPDGQLADALEE